ncbi:Fic family protein [Chelativorans salis]|uniref:Fic family protein n=1 Tax=Chelativorans salis TaxID=2978478 RepID=A0ABT2LR38_9HYPH|nr:Fic family protein [Chelativorans sp. EGI FJ00035]MCT7376816.1 Fic family protein [Chelativorans sp. EGI FJ00035]
MIWNWQQPDWPEFRHDKAALASLEETFLLRAGELFGAFRHVSPDDRDTLRIELISDEALKTSEIEGEILNRDSVQSSLRQQMGLNAETRRVPPEERGIAEMMVTLYRSYDNRLTHKSLFNWHKMVMAGHRGIEVIGAYRKHADPMQVNSGPVGREKVHFEAPPSNQVRAEMDAFVKWFNGSAPDEKGALPTLTRAGIGHLYFESIHPFEDGNGRIGRALSEKALAQKLGQPSLIMLAYTIERGRKTYYDMLERSNKDNEITDWLVYFAETVLEAQGNTLKRIEFQIAKARFYDRLRVKLNPRQEKAIARMFREGIDGFKRGLSAENYISITGASRATATRDLQDLVEKGALTRTGQRRHTRYWLNTEQRETYVSERRIATDQAAT